MKKRIYVKVIPRAGRNDIEKISEDQFRVRVSAAPEKGMANEAVVKILAGYFEIAKNSVSIVGGKSARTKIVDIDMGK